MSLLRKGDLVQVIAGKHRKSEKKQQEEAQRSKDHDIEILENRGRILEVLPAEDKVIVEGINFATKFERVRMTEKGREGGLMKLEAPIDISNVMYVDPKTDKPVRLAVHIEKDGTKRRITRGGNSSGTVID